MRRWSLILFLFAPMSFADEIKSRESRITDDHARFGFASEIRFMSTDANFTNTGNERDPLAAGNSYQHSAWRNTLMYRPKKTIEYRIGFEMAQAISETSQAKRDQTGLSQFSLAFDYDWVVPHGVWQPGVELIYPMTTVSDNQDQVLLGEGAIELNPHLAWKFNFYGVQMLSDIGASLRDGGRASLLNYKILPGFALGNTICRLGVRGYTTLVDDQYTSQSSKRLNIINAVDGGSYAFYSINPSQFAALFEIDWAMNAQWGFKLSADKTYTGRNSADALVVALGVVGHLGKIKPRIKTERDQKLEEFEPD